jgi:hypothetical protein
MTQLAYPNSDLAKNNTALNPTNTVYGQLHAFIDGYALSPLLLLLSEVDLLRILQL